jgi:hypothetical protein
VRLKFARKLRSHTASPRFALAKNYRFDFGWYSILSLARSLEPTGLRPQPWRNFLLGAPLATEWSVRLDSLAVAILDSRFIFLPYERCASEDAFAKFM